MLIQHYLHSSYKCPRESHAGHHGGKLRKKEEAGQLTDRLSVTMSSMSPSGTAASSLFVRLPKSSGTLLVSIGPDSAYNTNQMMTGSQDAIVQPHLWLDPNGQNHVWLQEPLPFSVIVIC